MTTAREALTRLREWAETADCPSHTDSDSTWNRAMVEAMKQIDRILAELPETVHLSSDMHPEFVSCGEICTPSVKRSPYAKDSTCLECLRVDAMGSEAAEEDDDAS